MHKILKMLKSVFPALFLVLCPGYFTGMGFCADEFYHPAPIVLVHGLGSSYSVAWGKTAGQLEKLFIDGGGQFKYFHRSIEEALPIISYGSISNEGVTLAAVGYVGPAIDETLSRIPSGTLEQEQKVILIAHSMGGLASRYLLQQRPDLKNKVKRIVFLGVPHLGSPLASWMSLVNCARRSKIPSLWRLKIPPFYKTEELWRQRE